MNELVLFDNKQNLAINQFSDIMNSELVMSQLVIRNHSSFEVESFHDIFFAFSLFSRASTHFSYSIVFQRGLKMVKFYSVNEWKSIK